MTKQEFAHTHKETEAAVSHAEREPWLRVRCHPALVNAGEAASDHREDKPPPADAKSS